MKLSRDASEGYMMANGRGFVSGDFLRMGIKFEPFMNVSMVARTFAAITALRAFSARRASSII